MNKNEFAEKLVKEFSVKHPNYSASVKKPEEEPVTDDVYSSRKTQIYKK